MRQLRGCPCHRPNPSPSPWAPEPPDNRAATSNGGASHRDLMAFGRLGRTAMASIPRIGHTHTDAHQTIAGGTAAVAAEHRIGRAAALRRR